MGAKEEQYVSQAFEENWLSTAGPNIVKLEKQFELLTGLSTVALSSGTASLHLGLKLLNISPGDEVVVPTLTFVAGCNPVIYESAKPIFVDSERESWNLDPQLLSDFLKKLNFQESLLQLYFNLTSTLLQL